MCAAQPEWKPMHKLQTTISFWNGDSRFMIMTAWQQDNKWKTVHYILACV